MKSIPEIFLTLSIPLTLALACGDQQKGADEPTAIPAEEETTGTVETEGTGEAAEELMASTQLQSAPDQNVSGTVTFTEKADGQVEVQADISGLEPGKHGFHVHEKGDCSAADFTSAGGHFNPEGTRHGAPDDEEHHAGDFGNIVADEEGNASVNMTVDYLTVSPGDNSVVGKAVVVHSGEDDLESQPSGDAGSRVACGVVELQH